MSIISSRPSLLATSALRAIPFENIIGGPLQACVKAQRLAAQTTVDFIREVGLEDVPVRDADGKVLMAPRLDRYGNEIKDEKGNAIMFPVFEKKAVYVCFQFIQGGKLVRLNVPMLSIVPIPYIAINTIDISFKANIKAQASTSEEVNTSDTSDSTSKGYESSYNSAYSRNKNESRNFFGTKRNKSESSSYSSDYSRNSMEASISSKRDSVGTRDSKYSVEYTMDVAVHASQDSMPAGMAKVLELIGNAMDVCDPDGEFLINAGVLVIEGEQKTASFEVAYKTPEGLITTDAKAFRLFKSNDSNKTNLLDGETVSRNKERVKLDLGDGTYMLENEDGTLTEEIKVIKVKPDGK